MPSIPLLCSKYIVIILYQDWKSDSLLFYPFFIYLSIYSILTVSECQQKQNISIPPLCGDIWKYKKFKAIKEMVWFTLHFYAHTQVIKFNTAVTFIPQNEKQVLLFLKLNSFIHRKVSVSYIPNIISNFWNLPFLPPSSLWHHCCCKNWVSKVMNMNEIIFSNTKDRLKKVLTTAVGNSVRCIFLLPS